MSTARTPSRRTLWEEGRHPGRLVRTVAVAALVAAAYVDVLVFGQLSVYFDAFFVTLCAAAALAVRPRDFFVVGVLPPLMMLGAVLLLALSVRDSVADSGDGLVQAVVSGLAHHAGALVTGYVLTLLVLALRQQAYRNTGAIRRGASRTGTSRPAVAAGPLGTDPKGPPASPVSPARPSPGVRVPRQREAAEQQSAIGS